MKLSAPPSSSWRCKQRELTSTRNVGIRVGASRGGAAEKQTVCFGEGSTTAGEGGEKRHGDAESRVILIPLCSGPIFGRGLLLT